MVQNGLNDLKRFKKNSLFSNYAWEMLTLFNLTHLCTNFVLVLFVVGRWPSKFKEIFWMPSFSLWFNLELPSMHCNGNTLFAIQEIGYQSFVFSLVGIYLKMFIVKNTPFNILLCGFIISFMNHYHIKGYRQEENIWLSNMKNVKYEQDLTLKYEAWKVFPLINSPKPLDLCPMSHVISHLFLVLYSMHLLV